MAWQHRMARVAVGEDPATIPEGFGALPTLRASLLSELGQGGQGTVWLALGADGSTVAIKTLPSSPGWGRRIPEPVLLRYAAAVTGGAATLTGAGLALAFLPRETGPEYIQYMRPHLRKGVWWNALQAAAAVEIRNSSGQDAAAAAVCAANEVLRKCGKWVLEGPPQVESLEQLSQGYADCRAAAAAAELQFQRQPVMATEVAAGRLDDLIKQGAHCGKGGLCRDGVGLLFQLHLLHGASKAVAALHAARMAHLDIKPANLLAVPRMGGAAVEGGSSDGGGDSGCARGQWLELRCGDLGSAFAPDLAAFLGGVGADASGASTWGFYHPDAPRSNLAEAQAIDMAAFATTCICALTGAQVRNIYPDGVPAWEHVPVALAAAGVGSSLPCESPEARALASVLSLIEATLMAPGCPGEGPDASEWERGLAAAVADFEATVPAAAQACAQLQGRVAKVALRACAPSEDGGFVDYLAATEKAAAAARNSSLPAQQGWGGYSGGVISGNGRNSGGGDGSSSRIGTASTAADKLVSAVEGLLQRKVVAVRPEALNAAADPVLRMLRGVGAAADAVALIKHWCGDSWVVRGGAHNRPLAAGGVTGCTADQQTAVPPWLRRDWWPSQADLAVMRAEMCVGGPLIIGVAPGPTGPLAAAPAAVGAPGTQPRSGPRLQLVTPPGLQQHLAALEEMQCSSMATDWAECEEEEEFGSDWDEEEEVEDEEGGEWGEEQYGEWEEGGEYEWGQQEQEDYQGDNWQEGDWQEGCEGEQH